MTQKFVTKAGVVISQDVYGKYTVELIFDGETELVTKDRPFHIAMREMHTALDTLSTQLSRHKIELTQPEAPKTRLT
jgi:hypothetical protein